MTEGDNKPIEPDTSLPFEYGRPDGNADFLGPKRKINAFIKVLEHPIEIELGNGEKIKYATGTKYLDLHLMGDEYDVADGEMTKVFELLKASAADLLALGEAMRTRKNMQGVAFLAGTTNERLANLATDSMGFLSITNTDEPDWLTAKFTGPTASVYTTPLELDKATKRNIKRLKRIEPRIYGAPKPKRKKS